MNGLARVARTLRTSLWFVPSLIIVVNIGLAIALIDMDSSGSDHWMARWPRLFGAGAAGARGMLSTIATSMMTVVGVTFSMLLVTLALASSQYTSRILRNFMRDPTTQIVLGIFAGTFSYSIVVLRTIRGGDEGPFVPSLAIAFGVVLAIGGICVLIFFIHHIASSIQASSIIARVADETLSAVNRMFPQSLGHDAPDDEDAPPMLGQRTWQPVTAQCNGYLQNIDDEVLLRFARKHQTIVRMEHRIGAFVVQHTSLASIALSAPPEATAVADLRRAYSIGRHRTLQQDCAFGIRQIVDMALRALSPGINDTTTAVMCVDYLTAILARLALKSMPAAHRYEGGKLMIIAVRPCFADFVAESFDQICTSASDNVGVMIRILDALQVISSRTTSLRRRQVLRDQAGRIAEAAARTIQSPDEWARIEDRLTQLRAAFETAPNLPSAHIKGQALA